MQNAVIPPKAETLFDCELNGTSKTHDRNQGKSYIIEEIVSKHPNVDYDLLKAYTPILNNRRSKIRINNETKDEIVIMKTLNVSLALML
jgi:hypothetical protein